MSDDKTIDAPLKEAERQAKKVATEYMYDLALHRHLPHALEDYHVKALRIGAHEPYSPGEIRYMPLEAVVVSDLEPLPAAFIKADITRERSQSLITKQQEKYRVLWESEFSSDKPYNPQPQFHTVLDGHNYPVVILHREPGVKREKIIGPRFKPLGYKGKNYRYNKKISEYETLECRFDFGTWRNSLDSTFMYDRVSHDALQRLSVRIPFIYWTIGKQEHAEGIVVMYIPFTTEKNLTMTFDNIAFLAQKLEEEMVPEWRQLASQLGMK